MSLVQQKEVVIIMVRPNDRNPLDNISDIAMLLGKMMSDSTSVNRGVNDLGVAFPFFNQPYRNVNNTSRRRFNQNAQEWYNSNPSHDEEAVGEDSSATGVNPTGLRYVISDDNVTLMADVPGVLEDDIDITFENGRDTKRKTIFISAQRKDQVGFKRINYSYVFNPTFNVDTNSEKIEATLENGVLTVVVPLLSDEQVGKKVKISVKSNSSSNKESSAEDSSINVKA